MAYRNFDPATLSRRNLLRGGAYLAAGSALAGLPIGRMALADGHGSNWGHVAALADKYVGEGKVANLIASFGFGQAEPQMVGKGTLGFTNPAAVGMDSLFRIYSMTKPITGMATMMCIDDGLIGLDQPLAEVLPAYADMQVLVDPAGSLDNVEPAKRPITIRQLLTHTAGIGYDIVNKGPLREAYAAKGLVSGQISKASLPGSPRIDPAPGLEVWADRLATVPLMYQPGTRWSYSASIDLLGRVIEVASGKSLDVFFQERILDPCGMTSTYWQVPASELERFTDNYAIANGFPFPVDPANNSIYAEKPPIHWGGSGLVSSPRDYDRFLQMLLGYGKIDGKRVMGELAVRVGTSNILPKGVTTEGAMIAGQGFGAGGRSVNGQYGWGGAAGTLAAVDFNANLRGTLFTQYLPSDSYPIRAEYMSALEADLKALKGA